MKATSLLFFSSSSIAVPLFEALLKDERFRIVGLVCQPDKPAGRGKELTAPVTKTLALAAGVPVYQPEKRSKDLVLLEELRKDPPDFLLTFSYGQLLSTDWLELPGREALNVHPSLLPLYRGPTPPQAALLHGDEKTGITLMKMVKEMDAGPLVFQHEFALGEMTVGELYEAIARRAAEWIPEDIFALAQKEDFSFVAQDESRVTFCEKISKEDAFENFVRGQEEVLRRYRAYTPWPGLWTTYEGKRLKLLKLLSSSMSVEAGRVHVEDERIFVGTEDKAVEILELQMEGKKAVTAAEFLRGFSDFAKACLAS